MKHLSTFRLVALLGLLAWLLAVPAVAQTTAPPWVRAVAATTSATLGFSNVAALAVDASGNVYVAGFFSQNVTFGSTTLVSAGNIDLFVAKYVPASGTWAWAVRGGGTGDDYALGIAVSGSSVYVTGSLVNNRADAYAATLQQASTSAAATPVLGVSARGDDDLLLAKYQDNGTSATLIWVQVGGGTGHDYGASVAVSGSSVYVAGLLTNDTANSEQVAFGSNGTAAGTIAQYGASATSSADVLVAKYQDTGTSATVAWTQVGGGVGYDAGYGVAVSGTNVYVAGTITNDYTNTRSVVFGGAGSTAGILPQYGASALGRNDVLVAKYQDTGTSATVAWTQVGGGTGTDAAYTVAVSGASVYVLGSISNTSTNDNQVVFGGASAAAGTLAQYGASTTYSDDIVLAAYQDNGLTATVRWTQVAGGSDYDIAYGLAVSGTSVYVAGGFYNNRADGNHVVFGGAGTAAGTLSRPGLSTPAGPDLVLARYTDDGPSATVNWTQIGGSGSSDYGECVALAGTKLYVGGRIQTPATFGTLTIGPSSSLEAAFVGALDVAGSLAAAGPSTLSRLSLYPSPASSGAVARLSGAPAGTPGQVVDALGRTVAIFTTDATGAATLPAGLAPGVYAVRVGAAVGRWVVE